MDLSALRRFGFLTLPNYSMIAATNAIEALRMANRLSGTATYSWRVLTLDGTPADASNGLSFHPTAALGDGGALDILFVCGGVSVRRAVDRRLLAALRRLARRGLALGALCTGSFALAESGLLDGYRCAIHWEDLAAIREEFPDIDFVDDLFAVDRGRITCTGGIAPLDLMLGVIESRAGHELATRISNEFLIERIRPGAERQHAAPRSRAAHPALTRALELIETHVEVPLPVAEIARRVGLSARQLERLFHRHLGHRPAAFAQSFRLERGQSLLRQTAMPVTAIGLACGFASAAHFSSAYRRRFGRSPRAERKSAMVKPEDAVRLAPDTPAGLVAKA